MEEWKEQGKELFYFCRSFLQMLTAAFCLPALSAEHNRGTRCLRPAVDPNSLQAFWHVCEGSFSQFSAWCES